jgi:branched-chain amino acid transport system substrate-binding protein
MTQKMFLRVSSLAIVLVLALAACGQKPGVHVAQQGFVQGPGGTPVPGQTGGTVAPGTTGGPSVNPSTGATSVVPGGTSSTAPKGPISGDRTGITGSTITIGLHAPVTGAAPISGDSFKAGKDLFWKYLENDLKKPLFGKHMNVLFADDQYTPTTAVSVCNQMSQSAFLLIGGAGADQIGACASFANQRKIPYLSPGVQDTGLKSLNSYFAVSMSYRQQIAPLLQLLKAKNSGGALDKCRAGGAGKDNKTLIGFVRPDTGNFDDAADELNKDKSQYGFQVKVYTVTKEGNSQEASSVAADMATSGVDIAFPITAPVFTSQLAINTGRNQCHPLYAGVAITNNINQVINLVCNNNEFQGATWLSPWPGWKEVHAGQYDPDFEKAAKKYAARYDTRTEGGDLLIALWGIMKEVYQMMIAAGPNMTRESFVQTMDGFKTSTGIFPDLSYTASDHLGAQNTHVLIGQCGSAPQFVTDPSHKDLYSHF